MTGSDQFMIDAILIRSLGTDEAPLRPLDQIFRVEHPIGSPFLLIPIFAGMRPEPLLSWAMAALTGHPFRQIVVRPLTIIIYKHRMAGQTPWLCLRRFESKILRNAPRLWRLQIFKRCGVPEVKLVFFFLRIPIPAPIFILQDGELPLSRVQLPMASSGITRSCSHVLNEVRRFLFWRLGRLLMCLSL